MRPPVDPGRLTREQRRSLALGHAVAEVLVRDPDRVLEMARSNLVSMLALHTRGSGKRLLHEWLVLLYGPTGQIVDALTSVEPPARELREFSPFAGVLTQHQRLAVLASFTAVEDAQHPSA